jgi:hypothetical protein
MSDERDRERDDGAPEGFRLEAPSSSDWALETTQRPLPKELLDAMKHPDVPGVVLDAITRRSTPAPADVDASPAASDRFAGPDEDTARYMLQAPGRASAREPGMRALDARRAADVGDAPPGAVWLLSVALGAVVLAWLSFGLFGR